MPRSFPIIWIAAFLVVIGVELFIIDNLDPYVVAIIIYAGINIILASSLNLINGFAGQFSMGHAGFMAVGAYSGAVVTMAFRDNYPAIFNEPALQPFVFIAAIFAGGLCSAAAGVIVGLPTLRLRGDYLAVVTLGFGEIIRVILLNLESVGGARGLTNIPGITSFFWVYGFVLICLFVITRLVDSPLGRSFLSVREDEIAAEAVGVNTTRSKVTAFALGAFFAGMAGALFAHYLRVLSPAIFDIQKSFEIIIMVVLGGMGSISGSVVAAVFLTIIREALRPLQQITGTDYRMVIYSLVLIVLMLTRPRGLFGTKEITDYLPERWKARFGVRRVSPKES
ncbi:MAG: branched-chain amino acid ABC transporter permease [Deltaproteobacteria bacterium]|nr:branched-chain amino acid ABC transporter permease [Deltaproteobacteria bacterium]